MTKVFNTSFEISLRILLILSYYRKAKTEDMITAIDFICVYGSSFGITENNLHGDNDYRFSEFARRRELVVEALKSLVLGGLINASEQSEGFRYVITQNGIDYCSSFESPYANEYRKLLKRVIEVLANKSEQEAIALINEKSVASLKVGEQDG